MVGVSQPATDHATTITARVTAAAGHRWKTTTMATARPRSPSRPTRRRDRSGARGPGDTTWGPADGVGEVTAEPYRAVLPGPVREPLGRRAPVGVRRRARE